LEYGRVVSREERPKEEDERIYSAASGDENPNQGVLVLVSTGTP
jgi:hypothetical protein